MLQLRLYNTLTRRVEPVPFQEGEPVRIYTCGLTVYDHPHIGNYRTFIAEDVLVKTLQYFGYPVRRVMNITDVGHLTSDADEGEDKLEVGAKREGKSAWEVAREYEVEFLADMGRLNLADPDQMVRATDTIPEQITFIQELERQGYAYTTSDGVYFDTSKLTDYGKLARLDIAGLQAGARVVLSGEKRQLTDFALWKFSPAGSKRDMEWDSPWGKGFPGWHIECSAIIASTLGKTIDIHCGGVDHIPVHHTNEIAQSEAVNHVALAKHWLHGEFLQIEGQKMSKSLGNIYTLDDLQARGFEPLAYRLLVYSAAYRSKLNFTWEGLSAAQEKLNEIRAKMQVWKSEARHGEGGEYRTRIQAALADDLNLPRVMAEVWALASSPLVGGDKVDLLTEIDMVLSLDLQRDPKPVEVSEEVQRLVELRQHAREVGDWNQADLLRQQIEAQGFTLEDKPEKSTLKAKNP